MFSLGALFVIVLGFLLLLYGIAFAAEQGWIPERWLRHPLTYVLSLGVYASVWTFYGALGLAQQYGYSFLASYLGASATFILTPILLLPLLRIVRTYQLSSVADLFAFRFRSQWAGSLTALLMLIATLPLMSIQIHAVADSIHILNDEVSAERIALLLCLLIAVFAVLFGVRHPSNRDKHRGLVAAMALGSLIKVLALVSLGMAALLGVFQGNTGLEAWLAANSDHVDRLYSPLNSGAWRTLLLAFFASAMLMPHMFHMLFAENLNPKTLYKAAWGFPLFLWLLAVAIPPILWAGLKLEFTGAPEFFGLQLGMHLSPLLAILAFVGGLAAASGILIVSAIALAGMIMNHLLVPFSTQTSSSHLYSRLVWARRALILAVSLACYLVYVALGPDQQLHHLGLVAFVAFIQFLPGALATLFWPAGNRQGFALGLVAGMSTWLATMLIPMLKPEFSPWDFSIDQSQWHLSALYALAANISLFLLGSSLFKQSREEQWAANSCALNALPRPQGHRLNLKHPDEFIELLTPRLGRRAARREVRQAQRDLGLQGRSRQLSPIMLSRLQQRLEVNLSALLGPVEAHNLFLSTSGTSPDPGELHLLESHLETYQDRLTGLAAELDELRRHHRQTLERLPVGVCSLSMSGEILLWNDEMSHLTGLQEADVVGASLEQLPAPWSELLCSFADESLPHRHNVKLMLNGLPRWCNLHKATLSEALYGGQVLLIEDQTENQLLGAKLEHSERLASIGRLAAGVAHEVGNPVTGIACLAQNVRYDTQQPEILEAAEQILEQTQRVKRILQSLMNFAHAGNHSHQQHEPLAPSVCIDQAIDLLKLDPRGKNLEFINRCDRDVQISGDPQRLLQVFINLLSNARDASGPEGQVVIDSELEPETLELSIIDQGCGIPAEIIEHLFEPFVTTKDPGEGTGLGLAMVYSIVEEHYGSISIESPADKSNNNGTRVILRLPRLAISPSNHHTG